MNYIVVRNPDLKKNFILCSGKNETFICMGEIQLKLQACIVWMLKNAFLSLTHVLFYTFLLNNATFFDKSVRENISVTKAFNLQLPATVALL